MNNVNNNYNNGGLWYPLFKVGIFLVIFSTVLGSCSEGRDVLRWINKSFTTGCSALGR